MDERAPGFRFYPTEEELVSFYLRTKLQGNRHDINRVIPVIDIYEHEPWHLPKLSGEVCHGETEQWFFFAPRQEREARGGRPTRTTASGFWKATGSPSYVYSSFNRVIGVKKTMVFYKGKAPSGRKTKWKMNEYRAIEEESPSQFGTTTVPKLRHELSLCRIYVVSGSFRAFDRRPLGAEASEAVNQQDHGHGTVMKPSQATQPISPETSWSAEEHFELPMNNLGVVHGSEPLWELEKLDCLFT